jgi:hypothetical protein
MADSSKQIFTEEISMSERLGEWERIARARKLALAAGKRRVGFQARRCVASASILTPDFNPGRYPEPAPVLASCYQRKPDDNLSRKSHASPD